MGNHRKFWGEINSAKKKILPPGGVVDLSTSVATVTEGVGKISYRHHDPIFPERMQQYDENVPSEIGGALSIGCIDSNPLNVT